jgi:hypothetical protein
MPRGRRALRTSYGYLAPPDAWVRGWECNNNGCGTGAEPAPRTWPYPCPRCGRPADPTFAEPWAHEARIYRIRQQLASPQPALRDEATIDQHVWAYEDACLRGDPAAMRDVWKAFHDARPSGWQDPGTWWLASTSLFQMLRLAADYDLDRAADLVLECYPFVDTRDLEGDDTRRTAARNFVSMCITVLERESVLEHPRGGEIDAAVRDVANRAESVLLDHHRAGFQRIGDLRARQRARAAKAPARSSAVDGLPPLSWRGPGRIESALADAAIDTAEMHDDIAPLDDLIRRVEAGAPGLAHLLRARRQVVLGDLPAAARELDLGARATDRSARRLRPQILATHGLVVARLDPDHPDRGVELCRAGRAAGLSWWRRTTPADAGLARVLLWRAQLSGGRSADVREAVGLIRRYCQRRKRYRADDRLLLQEALAAREALPGRPAGERRQRA